MMSAMLAAKAYAAAQSQPSLPVAPSPLKDDGPSFTEMVKGAVGDAVAASRNAETKMTAQAQGKGDLVDVVTAISSAQASLETVMAVRDQVISAYQQIMQMPI